MLNHGPSPSSVHLAIMMVTDCLKNNAGVAQVLVIIDQVDLFYQYFKLGAYIPDLVAAPAVPGPHILTL